MAAARPDDYHLTSRADSQILLRDGPMGTMLARHLAPGEVALDLVLRAPARVRAAHEAWLSAGARQLHTATLQALDLPTRRRRDVWAAALEVAREAAARRSDVVVAALAAPPSHGADLARSWYGDLEHLLEAGVMHVTCGCVTGRAAADAFCAAWGEVAVASGEPGLQASCSLTIAPSRGVDACRWILDIEGGEGLSVGLACCEGVAALRPWLEALCERHELVHVAPSAGIPVTGGDGEPRWPVGPAEWGDAAATLVDGLPVDALGACCGCTPDYLIAFREARG